MPSLTVQLLGQFRVTVAGRHIPDAAWRSRKARHLVALLALAPGHILRREEAMETLWPDHEPRAAAANLRHTLHIARRLLADASPPDLPDPIASQGGQIALWPHGPLASDVADFEAATREARQIRTPESYEQALALYRGDLLPEDRYEDWATGPRERLHAAQVDLLATLARLYEARGAFDDAVAALARVVEQEPGREEAHCGLMRLYALTGQRGRALRQWARLRTALQQEVAAEPSTESVRLYHDILADRFPRGEDRPSTSTPPPKHNLPTSLTSFIGRGDQQEGIARRLASPGTRLVTLIGAGGSGKTRLALAVARDALESYRDGVWLIDLAPLADPLLLPGAVARVLGIRESPDQPLTAVLAEALAPRETLLVIDNCEQLRDACAALAYELLRACPRLRILATSRGTLGVPGEIIWRVPGLDLPPQSAAVAALSGSEAVQLFVDRARWRHPDFVLTTENAAVIAAICRRLDGLPLAIELAAARLDVLSPTQVAARLDDLLDLLASGAKAASSRQLTLRATLDWSFALLPSAGRELLHRLAAFAGSWSLEAAEAVGAADGASHPGILASLAYLVDQSLVQVIAGDGEVRYRLLETIRQYAREKLARSGEEAQIRERHAAFYLSMAELAAPHLTGPEQSLWLARLEGEHDNLRAALQWSIHGSPDSGRATGARLASALLRFWYAHGHLGEGRRWLGALLDQGGDLSPQARAGLLMRAAQLAWAQGDYDRASTYAAESLSLNRALGDRLEIASALNVLGMVAAELEDHARAATLFEESLALHRDLGKMREVGVALGNLGLLVLQAGDHARAAAYFEENLALRREVGDSEGIAHALGDLAKVAFQRGDHERAARYSLEGLTAYRDLDLKRGMVDELETLALVASAQRQPVRALRLWGGAEALRATIGAPYNPPEQRQYERFLEDVRPQLDGGALSRALEAGRALTLPEVLDAALAASPSAAIAVGVLSPREREIAMLVAQGRSNAQIAATLGLAVGTVNLHVSHILRKLGCTSRVEIAARFNADTVAN